jgi:hypothetical protein
MMNLVPFASPSKDLESRFRLLTMNCDEEYQGHWGLRMTIKCLSHMQGF